MVVEFFGWVVGVYVFAAFLDVVGGVFNRPDSAGAGVLAEAYAVPEAPAEHVAGLGVVDWCGEDGGDVEDAGLGSAAVDAGCGGIDVTG